MSKKLEIVETFLSIQGEGKFAGRLAIFVRFAGCNFNCLGFKVTKLHNDKILQGCDTMKAVFTSEFKSLYKHYTPKELLEHIIKLKANLNPIIVITGGEPLIHHKKPEFIAFIELLLKNKFEVHFESNASIEIDFAKFSLYKKCYFALSVKLENSGVSRDKRLNFKALKAFFKHSKKSFYKFVLDRQSITNANALKQINEILTEVRGEVFCMPMGADKKELESNALSVANFCIQNGFNYSDRTHIRLWNDKEGV